MGCLEPSRDDLQGRDGKLPDSEVGILEARRIAGGEVPPETEVEVSPKGPIGVETHATPFDAVLYRLTDCLFGRLGVEEPRRIVLNVAGELYPQVVPSRVEVEPVRPVQVIAPGGTFVLSFFFWFLGSGFGLAVVLFLVLGSRFLPLTLHLRVLAAPR